jgi:hypothetical protein
MNNADPTRVAGLMCTEQRLSYSLKSPDELHQQRNEKRTVTLSVTDIHVTGDHATAVITDAWSKDPTYSKSETTDFDNENGDPRLSALWRPSTPCRES